LDIFATVAENPPRGIAHGCLLQNTVIDRPGNSRLKEGDEIAYEIKENLVVLTKASDGPVDDPFVTFDEWGSEADQKAYAKL
jgi:antitoxin PrlF